MDGLIIMIIVAFDQIWEGGGGLEVASCCSIVSSSDTLACGLFICRGGGVAVLGVWFLCVWFLCV